MFTSFTHRFRELAAMRRDVLPQSRRDPDCRGIALNISTERKNDPALSQPRKARRRQIPSNLVLTQPTGFAFRVEALRPDNAQIVIAIIGGDIADSRSAVLVRRPYYRV